MRIAFAVAHELLPALRLTTNAELIACAPADIKDVDAVVCGDERYAAARIAELRPRLRVLARAGSGVDAIDRVSAAKMGVHVTWQPGAYAAPVANTAMAYILAFARRIKELDASMRDGEWKRLPAMELENCTVGLLGVGRVGAILRERLLPFGCRILCSFAVQTDEPSVPLDTMLEESDFVSIHLRLVPQHRHIIGWDQLCLMKPTAYLINTARGGLVDEPRLCRR